MSDTFDPQPVPTVRQRPAPAGSWPPGTKLWSMAAAALALLAIIWFSGPATTGQHATAAPAAVPPTQPEAVRSLQQRLDEQARRVPPPQPVALVEAEPARTGTRSAAPDDGYAERRRHEDESLRASNVVESARQPPTTARSEAAGPSFPPSTADLAALMRALRPEASQPAQGVDVPAVPAVVAPRPAVREATAPPAAPPTPAGPLYLLAEGRFMEAVLVNKLEGSQAGPVIVMVTSAVFAPDHSTVIVPVGARVLGSSRPVQALNETRMAVSFHRLQLPNGIAYNLESPALDQIGTSGLHDRVDNHLASVFGAAAAVGLIAGFSQFVSGGYHTSDNGGTVVVTGGTEAVAQATSTTLNRFLNRLPTIIISAGHGVIVYITKDLELPAYHPVLR